MALHIDSTLSTYAQAAGVSISDLKSSNGKTALAAADKVFENIVDNPSALNNKNTVEDGIELEAGAYAEAHKGDTFANFQSHVNSLTGNNGIVANDLSGLASSNEVGNESTINAFAAALANTFIPTTTSGASAGSTGSASSTTPAGSGMGTMSTSNKGSAGGHDYQTTSVSAGSYEISYRQWNDHNNSLTVKDATGSTISLPAGMAAGGPGVFTLPGGGPTISVGTGGKNASMAVSYNGETQAVQYRGAGHKGGSTTSTFSGNIGGGTASAGSASTGSSSVPVNSHGQQEVNPDWVLSAESALGQAYGVSPDTIAAGANAYWLQQATGSASTPNFGNNTAAQKAYEIGEEFAENYINQGDARPGSITLGSTPSGMPTISGGPTTVSMGTNGATSSSGASSLPALNVSNQNTGFSAVGIAKALTTLSSAWGEDGGQAFTQGATDAWMQEYNPSAFQAPDLSNATPTESAAYMAGRAFAEAYHAGADQTASTNSGPTGSAITAFTPNG